MDSLFHLCHAGEHLQMDLASFQLKGDDVDWWMDQHDTPAHASCAEMCEALEGYFNHHAIEQRRKRVLYEG